MKRPSSSGTCVAPERCTGCYATLGLGRGVVCGARMNGLTATTCVRLLAHDGQHRGYGRDGYQVLWPVEKGSQP